MRKLYLLAFGLMGVAGLALIGLGFMLSLQATGAPVETRLSSPAAPSVAAAIELDTVAAPAVAAIELNTRDAITFSDEELATVDVSDPAWISDLAAFHRDDLMLSDESPLAMELVLPPAVPAPSAPAAALDWRRHHDDSEFFWHRIRWGETLSGIAARFGTTVWRLKWLNHIHNVNRIIAGHWLLIPDD